MENKEIIKILENSENHISILHNAIDMLRSENAELRAENETWQRVSDSTDKMEMSAVAKVLNYPGLGRNKIFKILRELSVLRYNNEPYQKYMDQGFFDVIEQEVQLEFGTKVNKKTVITQKGIDFIRRSIDKYLDLSEGVQKLAAGFGSFNNVSTDRAIKALRSSLLGEWRMNNGK